MSQKWYIIHTYSGFEKKVEEAIKERAKSRNLEHLVTEVLVPTETVEEMVKGERKLSHRKFYPGYVLVKMELTDDSWHLVKDTPKVTGFVGSKDEPVAIPEEEAAKIIAQMQEGVLRPICQLRRSGGRGTAGPGPGAGDDQRLRPAHAGGAGIYPIREDITSRQGAKAQGVK